MQTYTIIQVAGILLQYIISGLLMQYSKRGLTKQIRHYPIMSPTCSVGDMTGKMSNILGSMWCSIGIMWLGIIYPGRTVHCLPVAGMTAKWVEQSFGCTFSLLTPEANKRILTYDT